MVGPDTQRSSEHREAGSGRLVYLCYGDSERHWLELRASLLSALRHLPCECGVTVVVATDRPERVHALGLDVEVAHLEAAALARWRRCWLQRAIAGDALAPCCVVWISILSGG